MWYRPGDAPASASTAPSTSFSPIGQARPHEPEGGKTQTSDPIASFASRMRRAGGPRTAALRGNGETGAGERKYKQSRWDFMAPRKGRFWSKHVAHPSGTAPSPLSSGLPGRAGQSFCACRRDPEYVSRPFAGILASPGPTPAHGVQVVCALPIPLFDLVPFAAPTRELRVDRYYLTNHVPRLCLQLGFEAVVAALRVLRGVELEECCPGRSLQLELGFVRRWGLFDIDGARILV